VNSLEAQARVIRVPGKPLASIPCPIFGRLWQTSESAGLWWTSKRVGVQFFGIASLVLAQRFPCRSLEVPAEALVWDGGLTPGPLTLDILQERLLNRLWQFHENEAMR
jgi:hypothetical protein